MRNALRCKVLPMERERGLEPPTLCLGSRSGPVQVPIRLRPLVSASPYLIGSGDDSWVPQASAIAALFPSVWLQFCYSARSLFCSPRQNRPRTTKQADSAFPGPSRDGRHGNVRTPLGKRVQKQLWRRSRALTPPAGGNERGRTGGSINPATDDTPPMPPVPAPSGPVSGFVTGAPIATEGKLQVHGLLIS